MTEIRANRKRLTKPIATGKRTQIDSNFASIKDRMSSIRSDNGPFAALDLGSNSFHLQIASFESGKLRVIDRYKVMVRMAAGLQDDGSLREASLERALEALEKFAERLRGLPKDHIRVVGTNTLRAARNSGSFLKQAEALLGVPIDIIAGTEEARLIYLGVASDLATDNRKRLIIDIGGGSTELVIGRQQPRKLESLYMGCVSFTRRYFDDGVISAKRFRKAVNGARQVIGPAAETFNHKHWDQAIGASGTIRTIERILSANQIIDDHAITPKALQSLADELIQFDTLSDVKLSGLPDERQPVFPGGLAILTALFEDLAIDRMTVSDSAIREGIIHDLAGRFSHHDSRQHTIRHISRQYHLDRIQAKRVNSTAQRWLPAIAKRLKVDEHRASQLLEWAASLHEIGLSIAHSGYHKHSAYILQHADLPGFSRQEQRQLSFLVLNHRRKLRDLQDDYGFTPDWMLVSLFRLACLFHRRREDEPLPEGITLSSPDKKTLELTLPTDWIDSHPLTAEALEEEVQILSSRDIKLELTHPE